MQHHPAFDAAREALKQGDTAKALELVITHLEADRQHTDTVRTLRVVEANYNAARQQEMRGILAFGEAQREYNKVNDNLLAVLDGLSSGRIPVMQGSKAPVSSRWPLIAGIGALLLLLVVGAWWFLKADSEPECPQFRGPGLKVMILPFQNIGNSSKDGKPEISIQKLIRERAGSNQFPLAVEVMTGYNAAQANPDVYDAQPLGKTCNADMVIWGDYEYANDSIQVDTRFAFVGPEGRSGDLGAQAFSSIANIRAGRMNKSLDDAVFSLCAIMAIRDKRLPLAKKWLEKVVVKDERDTKILEKIQQMDSVVTERKGLIQQRLEGKKQ